MATRKKADEPIESQQQEHTALAETQAPLHDDAQESSATPTKQPQLDAEPVKKTPAKRAAPKKVSTATPKESQLETEAAPVKKPRAKRAAPKKATVKAETLSDAEDAAAHETAAVEMSEPSAQADMFAAVAEGDKAVQAAVEETAAETAAVEMSEPSAQTDTFAAVAEGDKTVQEPVQEVSPEATAKAVPQRTFDEKKPAKKKRQNAKTRREIAASSFVKKGHFADVTDKTADELPQESVPMQEPQSELEPIAAVVPGIDTEGNDGAEKIIQAVVTEPADASGEENSASEGEFANANEAAIEGELTDKNESVGEIVEANEAASEGEALIAAEIEDAPQKQSNLAQENEGMSESDCALPPIQPRKKHHWAFITFIILTLMVVLGSAVFVYTLFDSTDLVWFRATAVQELPNFLGQTQTEVEENEEYNLFTNIQYKEVYSETEDEGKVLAQFPKPPKKISVDTKITLTIGVGVQTTKIPELTGMTREEVLGLMKDSGLNLLVRTDRDSAKKVGTVTKTVPTAGETVKAGGTLEIYVAGEELQSVATVPNCYGKTLASGEGLLTNNGLSVGRINKVFSDAPEGTVVGQGMKPGTVTWVGNSISLTVSKGVEVIEAAPAPAPAPLPPSSSSSTVTEPPVVPEVPEPPVVPPVSSTVIPPVSVPAVISKLP